MKLTPDDKIIHKEWEKDMKEAKEYVRKLSIISTKDKDKEEPVEEKENVQEKVHKSFCSTWESYTRCPRGNVPDFGRLFLKLKYANLTKNTYIRSWTVMEIMAREVWKYDSCYTLIDYQIHIKTGRNMWLL